jgi:hypothetical protein
VSDDAQHNPQSGPRNMEKDALEGVEADKSAPVVRLHYEEHDRGNDGLVSQHAATLSVSPPAVAGAGRAAGAPERLHVGQIVDHLGFEHHTPR